MKGTLQELKEALRSYTKLKPNWDGYGGLPIKRNVANEAIEILEKTSEYLPEIFPTGRDTIQFEYYYGNYFAEIEIGHEGWVLIGDEEDSSNWVEKKMPVLELSDFINAVNGEWRAQIKKEIK